ncbi:MAG: SH3 domain-containing protein [Erysipelotrichaceae bacterium]|nr:SH3 domain-containing protein [Erysipelotrichaceae bacterium]
MPEKNPYESQETLDIPDFVEKKKDVQESVDMSVFKLEDDDKENEVTEEVEEEEEERPVRRGSRRLKNNVMIAGGILLAVMAVLMIASLIFAGSQRSALKKKQAELDKLQTEMTTMKTQYETQINDLKKQIEELSKPVTPTPSGSGSTVPANGTRYLVTASNGINLRAKASVESDLVGSVDNGAEVVIIGDLVKDDEGRQWGKIDDNTWICLINGEEVYAEVIQ